jgi:hypothetical protein
MEDTVAYVGVIEIHFHRMKNKIIQDEPASFTISTFGLSWWEVFDEVHGKIKQIMRAHNLDPNKYRASSRLSREVGPVRLNYPQRRRAPAPKPFIMPDAPAEPIRKAIRRAAKRAKGTAEPSP